MTHRPIAACSRPPVHAHAPRRSRMPGVALCLLLAGAMAVLGGCQRWRDRKKPIPKPEIRAPQISRDVPSSLRGTVGAEASITGVEQTLVSGIGFVVGLNGTGGLTIPEQYAAHLERMMGLNGIGIGNTRDGSPLEGKTPSELMRDPNTAAVIVQAAVPAGAREGESFDVYVRAINATSLEGGTLWTTELRIGPPSAFGNPQARVIGQAKGPIFINPFAEPGGQYDGVTRDVGRILDGGAVTFPTKVEIILDNPSHQRARQIVSAINTAFPQKKGEREPTARGKDDTLILVQIPSRYIDRRAEFLDLLAHVTIDQAYPEIYARRYARTLVNEPYLAGDMSLCLEALGERAIPFLGDLYTHPEAAPRLAALRAGAALRDARVVKPLRDMALDTESRYRTDAMALMSMIDESALVDNTLRTLLEDKQLAVRVEAYENLMDRALRVRRARVRQMLAGNQQGIIASATQIEALTKAYLPPDPIRGVGRTLVEGKFFLDIVPYGDPLIYVTQQNEPRIVLFGDDLNLERPMLATAWSDRFMLAADSFEDPIRLYYRDDIRRTTATMSDVPQSMPELVKFLAHQPTPENPRPGLGFSYSQVVGVLYEIFSDKGVRAAFTTEEDRLIADLLESVTTEEVTMRAESESSGAVMVPVDDPSAPVVGENEATRRTRRTLLVPVTPTDPDAQQDQSREQGGGGGSSREE